MSGTNEIRVATLGLGIDPKAAERGAKTWGKVNKRVRNDATKTVNHTNSVFSKLNMSKAIKGLAAFGAAYLGIRTMIRTVNIASDAEEIQSKFDVVFGSGAEKANQWAADYGQAVGRARQDIKKYASGIQDTLVPMGIQRQEAAKLSKEIVKLGIDVASFNNATDEEVLNSFNSALVGNVEAVRKYGIVMTQSRMKLEAHSLGLGDNLQKLSEAQKLLVRYSILQKSTTDAQSDAIRTAASYANQTKRLRGNLKNLGEIIGKALLPAFNYFVTSFNNGLQKNEGTITRWSKKIGAYIKYAIDVAKTFTQFMKDDWKGAAGAGLDLSLVKFKEWGKKLLVIIEQIVSYIATNVPVMMKRAIARWKLESSITKQVTKQINASARNLSDKVLGSQFNMTPDQMGFMDQDFGGKSGRDVLKEQWAAMEIDKHVQAELSKANARIERDNPFRGEKMFDGLGDKLSQVTQDLSAERQKIVAEVAQTSAGKEFVANLQQAKAKLSAELKTVDLQSGTTAAVDGTKQISDNLATASQNAFDLNAALANAGSTSVQTAEKQKENLEVSQGLAQNVGNAFSGAFNDALQGSFDLRKSLSEMFSQIAQQLFQQLIISRIVGGLSGMFGGMGGAGGGLAAAAANGAVLRGGRLMAFANGGIVNRPTLFPMANGAGLMGEKGPEAIMPLSRGSDGKLGVASEQAAPNVNIVNVIDQEQVATLMASSRGEKIIMNTLRQNRQAARQLIT